MSAGIVLLATALSGGAGLLLGGDVTATASIALTNPGANSVIAPGVTGDASLTRYTAQRAQFALSDTVLEPIATRHSTTLTALRADITVDAGSSANTLTVTATGATAQDAVSLANDVLASYSTETLADVQKRTTTAVTALERSEKAVTTALAAGTGSKSAAASTLSYLQQQAAALETDAKVYGDGVDFTSLAQLDNVVAPGLPIKETAVGLVLGLGLAGVISWLRADRDRLVRSPGDAAAALGAPLLAELPSRRVAAAGPQATLTVPGPGGIVATVGRAWPATAFRLTGASLAQRAPHAVIAVVSPGSAGLRVESALDLAISVGIDGRRVLLVDADPQALLSQRLGLAAPESLLNAGAPAVAWVSVEKEISLGVRTLGRHDVWESPSARRAIVEELREQAGKFDLVIIDLPAPDSGALVPALLRLTDHVLAIVPHGTDQAALAGLRQTTEVFAAPLTGYLFAPGGDS